MDTPYGESLLGTPRARQLRTIGRELSTGGLMSEDLLELARDALSESLNGRVTNLGNGVHRRMVVAEADDNHVDIEVWITEYADPVEHRYRIRLDVQEME